MERLQLYGFVQGFLVSPVEGKQRSPMTQQQLHPAFKHQMYERLEYPLLTFVLADQTWQSQVRSSSNFHYILAVQSLTFIHEKLWRMGFYQISITELKTDFRQPSLLGSTLGCSHPLEVTVSSRDCTESCFWLIFF